MRRPRVVAVDDSDLFLETVQDILTEAGYEVRAEPGQELTVDRLAELSPDAIVLDLVLHDARSSGWDLFRAIRDHPDLATVPVILCSADTAQLTLRSAELEPMQPAYLLAKPFSLEEMELTVRTALGAAEREVS